MISFGQQIRHFRRRCWDSLRNRPLSQERLGELLGIELGDAGYSGAAVSDWERDRSKIHEDNRQVLVALTKILYRHGGLTTAEEADELLRTGNYRTLDPVEFNTVFPDLLQEQKTQEGEIHGQEDAHAGQYGPTSPLSAEPISRMRCKQLILLEKVKRFWVEGVLENSIRDATVLHLAQERIDEAIDHPWGRAFEATRDSDRLTNQTTSTLTLFQECDRALLILGEPGSGKTTTLITLARDLIIRAEANPFEPVPIILNLVSWAEKRAALADWVVEELTAKYLIPHEAGRQWLENDDLLLMLDGFDEVEERYRRECIRTINRFRKHRGLSGIVMCSRTGEYSAAGIRLRMGGAVETQPLTVHQIDGYLAADPQLSALRSAVRRDAMIQDMARSPLMLNVMRLAYSNSALALSGFLIEPTTKKGEAVAGRQRRLFEAYVEHMIQRRSADKQTEPEQIQRRLAWLARKMFQHNQSPFLIEQIQPIWLPGRKWRWVYMILTGLFIGLVAGLITWLLLQQLRQTTPQLSANVSRWVAERLTLSIRQAEWLTLLGGNVLLGLVTAILQGSTFEKLIIKEVDPGQRNRLVYRHVAMVGLIVAALTASTVSLFGDRTLAFGWAIVEALVYMTVARYVYGRSYNDEIKPVEVLSWSWPRAVKGLVLGLILALLFEGLGWLLYGQLAIRWTAVIPGAGGLILGGLRGRRIESTSRPNQGIFLSFRNSLIAGTLSGLALAILGWYLFQPIYGLYTGLLVFVAAGSLSGGSNVLKHILVRSLLWLSGDMAWRCARFLDYAAGLVLLRKVGGGYIFIHPLFQQYFASLYQSPEQLSPAQVSYALASERYSS